MGIGKDDDDDDDEARAIIDLGEKKNESDADAEEAEKTEEDEETRRASLDRRDAHIQERILSVSREKENKFLFLFFYGKEEK